MKLGSIVNPEFTEAMRRLSTQRLPLRTAYRIKKLISKLDKEAGVYHEVRTTALLDYANKDESDNPIISDDGSVQMNPENQEAFVSHIAELLDTEIEFEAIKVEDLGQNIEISPQDLQVLDGVVAFDE